MEINDLKSKIKGIFNTKFKKTTPSTSGEPSVEYDELTKFPELKAVIVNLLTPSYDYFLGSIDWVAPKPTTFRINLKNNQYFYLVYSKRGWTVEVEGKKYKLINLNEEENAIASIAQILRYGVPDYGDEQSPESYSSGGGGDYPGGGSSSSSPELEDNDSGQGASDDIGAPIDDAIEDSGEEI